MVDQAGINKFILYSAEDTTWDFTSEGAVTNLSGTQIDVPINERPNFTNNISVVNRKVKYNYQFAFKLFGLSQEQVNQLNTINGWFLFISFLNGAEYFIQTPSFLQNTDLDTNLTNVYDIILQNERPADKPTIVDETPEPPAEIFAVQNGGYITTTDWIDSNTDGIADDFNIPNGTPSIITGNGFNGNAQRVQATSGITTGIQSEVDINIPTGTNIRAHFTYRASVAWEFRPSFENVTTIPSNTGNAQPYTYDFSDSIDNLIEFFGNIPSPSIGDWLEVDNLYFEILN